MAMHAIRPFSRHLLLTLTVATPLQAVHDLWQGSAATTTAAAAAAAKFGVPAVQKIDTPTAIAYATVARLVQSAAGLKHSALVKPYTLTPSLSQANVALYPHSTSTIHDIR